MSGSRQPCDVDIPLDDHLAANEDAPVAGHSGEGTGGDGQDMSWEEAWDARWRARYLRAIMATSWGRENPTQAQAEVEALMRM